MCGVAGAFNVDNPPAVVGTMIKDRLNNRGQNGAGLAAGRSKEDFSIEKSEWDSTDLIRRLTKHGFFESSDRYQCAIGHTRYGTRGARRSLQDTQPIAADMSWGRIVISHNGDSQFAEESREALIQKGSVFSTSSDTELILHYAAMAGIDDSIESIKEGLRQYRGTYALTMLVQDKNGIRLIAARDPTGNRPLCMGRLNGGYVLASENSAFERVGADYDRDIKPNEFLIISDTGIESETICSTSENTNLCQCIYELGYFMRPNSRAYGIPVYAFREELGRRLALRYGDLVHSGDILSFIPESANFYAQSFADTIEHPLAKLIIRTRTDRSFIEENQQTVTDTLRSKFGFLHDRIYEIIQRKPDAKLFLIDDSIVHGNTARRISRVFREAGFRSINWLYGEPPLLGPCNKGIDMIGPGRQLLAVQYLPNDSLIPDCDRIAADIEADSVNYLHLTDLHDTAHVLGGKVGFTKSDFCYGCFENRDPIWRQW